MVIDALHNSDFRFPVSMNTRLKMYSVSRWKKAQRNKVKEKSAHILVAPIECTMQKGKKHALDFLHFQRMESFVAFGKTVWRESRGTTVSV